MIEPKKIYVGAYDIRAMSIEFPSGKKIVIGYGKEPYLTDDQAEIDFASRLTGVCIGSLTDKEFRSYFTNLLERAPVIGGPVSEDDAREFVWKDELEPVIVSELKKRGYRVSKAAESASKPRKPRGKKE